MKKLFLMVSVFAALAGCACPETPAQGDLLRATVQFRPELFETGARGIVVASLADNRSKSGWFRIAYDDIISFKNVMTGEEFHLSTSLNGPAYDTIMLTIGKYEVTNLFLQRVYETTEQMGNTTVHTTHIETDEGYLGKRKLTFDVLPGKVVYLGHFDLIAPENKVAADGKVQGKTFKFSNKMKEIPAEQREEWRKKYGRDLTAKLIVEK